MGRKIVKRATSELKKATGIARLNTFRSQALPDGSTIHEFWQREKTNGGRMTDPKEPRQMAFIHLKPNGTFTFGWYPWQQPPQVFPDLPIDKLEDAVTDLCGAGFGKMSEKYRAQPTVDKPLALPPSDSPCALTNTG